MYFECSTVTAQLSQVEVRFPMIFDFSLPQNIAKKIARENACVWGYLYIMTAAKSFTPLE
jgi:hypothetical protein